MRWRAAQGMSAGGARGRGLEVSEGEVCGSPQRDAKVRRSARRCKVGGGRVGGRKPGGVWSARLIMLVLGAPQRRGAVGGRTAQAADEAREPGLQCGAGGSGSGRCARASSGAAAAKFAGRTGAGGVRGRAGGCRGLQRQRGAGGGRGSESTLGHAWRRAWRGRPTR
jgi:hypothetical protein